MSIEYAITLENKNYFAAVKVLSAAFQPFSETYSFKSDDNGFSLCGDNPKWSDVLQIFINTADSNISVLPVGEPYLYCCLNNDGRERKQMIELIKATFGNIPCSYSIDEL